MDMISIGKFIAQLRKEKRLTQEKLGEKLGVSGKTISRWETGTYMPPADALMAMSGLFSVSVNEILSGKRLAPEEYRNAAEENIVSALKRSGFSLKEKLAFYKKKWLKEHIALMAVMGVIAAAALVAGAVLGNGVIVCAAVLLSAVFYCYINNTMMSYAEKHTYDGSGGDRS